MPGRENRLLDWITDSREIRSVRQKGKLYKGSNLFIWVCEGDTEAEVPRVAIVTGRGFPGAVSRNLAKRRVRGSLLDRRQELEPGKCYLVEGRKGVEKASYQLLVIEVDDILSRTRNCVNKREPVPGGESR